MSLQNTSIIPELKELTYEYLDPISYLRDIAKAPESFDIKLYQKILKNYQKSEPAILLQEAYQTAQEIIQKISSDEYIGGPRKIDPRYVCGLVLKAISTDGHDLSDSEEYVLEKVMGVIKKQTDLLEIEFDELLNYLDDQKLADIIRSFDKKVRKQLVIEGCQILRQTHPLVYDTTYFSDYAPHLGIVLENLIENKYSNKSLTTKNNKQ